MALLDWFELCSHDALFGSSFALYWRCATLSIYIILIEMVMIIILSMTGTSEPANMGISSIQRYMCVLHTLSKLAFPEPQKQCSSLGVWVYIILCAMYEQSRVFSRLDSSFSFTSHLCFYVDSAFFRNEGTFIDKYQMNERMFRQRIVLMLFLFGYRYCSKTGVKWTISFSSWMLKHGLHTHSTSHDAPA